VLSVLTRSSYVETLFSVFSRPENCPSVGDVLISGGRLFRANDPCCHDNENVKILTQN